MDKDDLRKFCTLPTWRVEVERKINPDKSSHKIFWEWVTLDGKRSEGVPKNKIGKWQLFVDVVTPGKCVSTFDTGETDLAWEKLLEAATNAGYERKPDQEEFTLDLQNGILKFTVVRMLTDEGYVPELKLVYKDKDDLFSSTFELNMENTDNLKHLGEMFLTLAQKLGA